MNVVLLVSQLDDMIVKLRFFVDCFHCVCVCVCVCVSIYLCYYVVTKKEKEL